MTFVLAFTKIALKIYASSLSSSLGGTYSVDIFGCLEIRELKRVYIFAAQKFPYVGQSVVLTSTYMVLYTM